MKLLDELQYNFSVAGPASLQLLDTKEDPVAVARQMYLHYLGTTHVTEAHAEDFIRVSSEIRVTVRDYSLIIAKVFENIL